jgi:nitrous-oxide reductase
MTAGQLQRSRLQGAVKKVVDTQAVIDSVVGYITSVNYKDFPDVVAMMDDAVDQLGKIKDAKAKADAAAGQEGLEQRQPVDRADLAIPGQGGGPRPACQDLP